MQDRRPGGILSSPHQLYSCVFSDSKVYPEVGEILFAQLFACIHMNICKSSVPHHTGSCMLTSEFDIASSDTDYYS